MSRETSVGVTTEVMWVEEWEVRKWPIHVTTYAQEFAFEQEEERMGVTGEMGDGDKLLFVL